MPGGLKLGFGMHLINIKQKNVEIRSVTSEIRRQKRKEVKTTVVKYKPFGITMPCDLINLS